MKTIARDSKGASPSRRARCHISALIFLVPMMKMLCGVLLMKMLSPMQPGAMVIFPRNKIIVPRIKIFVPMKTIFVPIIKMRSALLHDDVDTGAGGDGSLHFYPPLPSITFTTQPPRNLCPL